MAKTALDLTRVVNERLQQLAVSIRNELREVQRVLGGLEEG